MPDGSTTGYILAYIALNMVSAFFAAAETSFSTVSKVKTTSAAAAGDKKAKKVLYILENFDKAITTIIIGNNIMQIGSATLSTLIATSIWGIEAIPVATLVTTIVLFFAAEMIPKCFAKACNETLAPVIAPIMYVLIKILYPLSVIFTKISDGISKPFTKRAAAEYTVTKEEISDIVDSISENDEIKSDSSALVKSAMDFSDLLVSQAVTPWKDVCSLNINLSVADALEIIKSNTHSRLVLLEDDGSVCGILNIRKYLKLYHRNEHFRNLKSLKSVADKAFWVNSNVPICDALNKMSAAQANLAIVSDNVGNPCGITTVEAITLKLIGTLDTTKGGGK